MSLLNTLFRLNWRWPTCTQCSCHCFSRTFELDEYSVLSTGQNARHTLFGRLFSLKHTHSHSLFHTYTVPVYALLFLFVSISDRVIQWTSSILWSHWIQWQLQFKISGSLFGIKFTNHANHFADLPSMVIAARILLLYSSDSLFIWHLV